ncbi:PIN domain-containing protein [Rhodohalobacter sp. SW132]|uniref:PIN domain-containing protein n=1 Tax=Rhodohalobacter sp. SW132 TaxID=2293433 RepID=UPI000E220488|nr:PIN domain-containing protein [Rhodohalobacter sp. SW132]REL38503.1 PIN domain-containing protein [Rhodohalobacter sp. SW132]
MKKILIDSDVCLDSITSRYPFSVNADKILQLAEENTIEALVTAESFSNMFYILRKLSNPAKAISVLKDLRSVVQIAAVGHSVIDSALNSAWTDFEDAIQYHCAIEVKCDAIVTRNVSDFKKASIPVHSPPEFLSQYH